ncbi:MAG: hypothetical protein CMJ85_13460 [Planctomycetes bacterium]|nr:hypothetical protein [Planctomycetota bacterium]
MSDTVQDPSEFPAPWNYLIPLAKRALIWGTFFALLWVFRHFLPLVFLTFVFAYVAEHGVEGIAHWVKSRRWRTAIVFLTMIGVIGLTATLLSPQLKNQAVSFIQNAGKHEAAINDFLDKQRASSPFMKDMLDEVHAKDILGELLGKSKEVDPSTSFHETWGLLLGIFRNAASATTTFLLSMLFAFLVVADLPRMARGIESLKKTRLRHFYDEVSTTVFRFAQVLGRFLEAQLLIAIINTALTATGMLFLGIPQIAFLSGVVFVCSFIPVAGVFISTLPICIVTLDHSGISLVLLAIGMIAVVHIVEGYVLNPLIFGTHLKLNPVVVMIVLLVGHELAGIWGLLLGVPAITYLFGHAIRYDKA